MIYGFARQSGGQVHIDSVVGRGTTLTLYFPRVDGEAPGEEASPDQPVGARSSGETVVVVDDEPILRAIVTDVLADLGYQTVEASDGAQGLAILESDATVDLLITDVGLPKGMNGRQLADAARVKRPDLKVLFITGYAENAVIGERKLEPGMHLLTKPFEMDVLAGKVREIIGD